MNPLLAPPVAAAHGTKAQAAGSHAASKPEGVPAADAFAALLDALSAAAPEEGDTQAGLAQLQLPEPTAEAEGRTPEATPAGDPALLALLLPPELPAVVIPPEATASIAPPPAAAPDPATVPALVPASLPAPVPATALPAAIEQRHAEPPKAVAAGPAQPPAAPAQVMAPLAAPKRIDPPSPSALPQSREPGPEPAPAAPITIRPAATSPETPRMEPQRPAPPAPDAAPIAAAMAPMRDVPPALAGLAASAQPAEAPARVTESAALPSPVFGFTPVPADAARPVLQATLQSTPAAPAFATELTAQVRVMLDGEVHSARLELNPPELGPIRIELSLHAGSADITFAAAHASTREGIAQALPQLREMFAQQGLQLADAGVSSGNGQPGAQHQHAARDDAAPRLTPLAQGEPARGGGATATLQLADRIGPARGALDLYA